MNVVPLLALLLLLNTLQGAQAGLGIIASITAVLTGAPLLQDVISSNDMDCNRNVAIEISNHLADRNLTYAGEYMSSGVNRVPCQPTIVRGMIHACGFSKR